MGESRQNNTRLHCSVYKTLAITLREPGVVQDKSFLPGLVFVVGKIPT